MKRFGKLLAAVMGIALVGAASAQANDGWGGGSNCGPSRGYSSRSYDNLGGYGRGSFGGYGNGGYSRGWSGSSHYDDHPTQIQRGHIDVQPGHYDRYSSRHWDW